MREPNAKLAVAWWADISRRTLDRPLSEESAAEMAGEGLVRISDDRARQRSAFVSEIESAFGRLLAPSDNPGGDVAWAANTIEVLRGALLATGHTNYCEGCHYEHTEEATRNIGLGFRHALREIANSGGKPS